MASEADLEALVRLAVALRAQVGPSPPSAAELGSSIARLLHEASPEVLLASPSTGAAGGSVQGRSRYSAWLLALEAEREDVLVVREVRRRGVGQRLVALAMARATAQGWRSLGRSPQEGNPAAVPWYPPGGCVADSARWQGGRDLGLQRTRAPA